MKSNLSLNSEELKKFLLYHIENNKKLVEIGQLPLAISIIGDAGCGKTSIVEETAAETNMDFYKFSPQQCSEVSDIQGYPNRQFKMCHSEFVKKTKFIKNENGETVQTEVVEKFDGETCVWVDEQFIPEWTRKGYTSNGMSRETFLPPFWVADRERPMILLIDDYTRCQKRHLQALMELILTQGFTGWHLPKGSMVILTENEYESGIYDVNEIDPAMRSRFLTIPMKFDVNCWAKWAESALIDTRAINFILFNPSLIDHSDENLKDEDHRVNARSMTQFFNSIRSIKNFTDLENIALIKQNGISIGGRISEMFITFANQGLDRIPSPEEMLESTKETNGVPDVITTMEELINEPSRYRADIATTLATRLINYSVYKANKGEFTKKMMDRFSMIIKHPNIFKPDIRMRVCKVTLNGNVNKFKKLVIDPEIQKAMFPNISK